MSLHQASERTNKASYTALVQAARRNRDTGNIDSWSVKIVNAFAEAFGMTPGKLIDALQGNAAQARIKYDDERLILQGYQFSPKDRRLYVDIKNAVLNSTIPDFVPTESDIEMAASIIENPNATEYTVWREKWLQSTVLQVINHQN